MFSRPSALGPPGRADRVAPVGVQGAGATVRVSVRRPGGRNTACAVSPTASSSSPGP